MNALVKLGMNTPQLDQPTAAQRAAAARDVKSLATANAAGRSGNTKALKAAADGLSGPTSNSMDQDMFLSLLMQQMQYQDPLDPMDNTDMIAQLAQFTSLEQMNNLNDSFEALGESFSQMSFLNATNLVGRTVTGVSTNGDLVEGEVTRVILSDEGVYLTVNDQSVPIDGVGIVE